MADQPPQQAAPAPMAMRPAPPAPAKKSFIAKIAGSIASHAYMSLAIIVVLIILVIGIYVYYHGFLFLGPYAKKSNFRSGKKRPAGGGDAGAGDEAGDPETERLIDSINHQ